MKRNEKNMFVKCAQKRTEKLAQFLSFFSLAMTTNKLHLTQIINFSDKSYNFSFLFLLAMLQKLNSFFHCLPVRFFSVAISRGRKSFFFSTAIRPFPSVLFFFNKLFCLQMTSALIENFIHLAKTHSLRRGSIEVETNMESHFLPVSIKMFFYFL